MSKSESRVRNAVRDVRSGRFTNATAAANFHGAASTTVGHRLRGRAPRSQIELTSLRLFPQEERCIVEWIRDAQSQAAPPGHDLIRGVVTKLLEKKGDFKPLGKKWTTKFLKRHKLQTGRSKKQELQRLTSLTYDEIDY